MRLATGLLALWRRDGESQLGSDPRVAVVLEGLSGAQQRALDVLSRRAVDSSVELAHEAHAGVREVRDLVRRLAAAGALVDPPRAVAAWAAARGGTTVATGRTGTPARARGPAAPADPTGEQTSVLRRRAVVAVVGGRPLGLGIARLLAGAGVGTVAVLDPAPVLPADVSAVGYHAADVGRPREVAAVAHLRHCRPDVDTRPPERPDAVVLVESRVSVPFRSSALVSADVPHLSVVLRELDVLVGPAVRPGRDACLRCLDLHRRDADPCWPAVATQLAVAPSPALEAATIATAAGLACSAVLAMLEDEDGDAAPWRRSLEIGGGTVAERRWAPHPECGCGAQGTVRG